jgi:hypothetical protein
MDNPEKLATSGTQDEEKQNKNTTQYVLDTTMRKQTQITYKLHWMYMFCSFSRDNQVSIKLTHLLGTPDISFGHVTLVVIILGVM